MLTDDQLAKIGPKAKDLHDRMHEAIDDLMWYQGKDFPAMGNKTPAFLVDQVGAFKDIEKRAKKATETLNGIIDSKLLQPGAQIPMDCKGDYYVCTITGQISERLDTAKAREYIFQQGGQRAVDSCTMTIESTVHRYKEV